MPKIHYHPCPRALGEYDYLTDTIILHEGLKKYQKIHDAILNHERDHAHIFKKHSGWIKRLVLNVKLDYNARISRETRVPFEQLRELTPSSFNYDIYQALYIIAYIPLLIAEGIYYTLKGIFESNRSNNLKNPGKFSE